MLWLQSLCRAYRDWRDFLEARRTNSSSASAKYEIYRTRFGLRRAGVSQNVAPALRASGRPCPGEHGGLE